MFGFFRTALNRLTSAGTEPSGIGRLFLGARTPAGTFVDRDRSLRNATVWACVQYLTKAVAQLPWRVVREHDNGDVERVVSSPVDSMLNQHPNPEMGAFTRRQTLLGHALLWGNDYAEIKRAMAGRALYLWPIHPSRVSPQRDAHGVLYHEVWNGITGRVDLTASDIFHLKGFGDGPVGHNVVEYTTQSILGTVTFSVMGRDMRTLSGGASPYFVSPSAETTTSIVASVNDAWLLGGADVALTGEAGQVITANFQALKYLGSIPGRPNTTIRILDTEVA